MYGPGLHDGYGRVHLIVPESEVWLIWSVNIELSRELRCLPIQGQQALIDKCGWQDLPVIPHLNGLPVILNPSIYQMDKLCVPSDSEGKMRYRSIRRCLPG